MPYAGRASTSNMPTGCYLGNDYKVHFNLDSTGATRNEANRICKVAGKG